MYINTCLSIRLPRGNTKFTTQCVENFSKCKQLFFKMSRSGGNCYDLLMNVK